MRQSEVDANRALITKRQQMLDYRKTLKEQANEKKTRNNVESNLAKVVERNMLNTMKKQDSRIRLDQEKSRMQNHLFGQRYL